MQIQQFEECLPSTELQTEKVENKRTEKSSQASRQSEINCTDELSDSMFHGEPFTDRKSTFQAHATEVHSMDEVIIIIH